MRALYIPAALLAAILAFSLWAGGFIDQKSQEWSDLLGQAEQLAQAGDWTGAEEKLRRAQERWQSTETFFHTVLDHRELDEAQALFAGAFAACREQDNEDFHILLAQLNIRLQLLAETQAVSVKNIL